jgi:hypothetical protein
MKKRPARREVTSSVVTSRLRTSDEAILDLVMDFLRMTSDLAPHVYRDLLDGAKGNELDEKSLQEIARAWAEKWHLSGADGPCDWAVLIAVDTLKFTPAFGWNLNTFLASEFGSTGMVQRRISPDEKDDREFEIRVSEAKYRWRAWRENPSELLERILAKTKLEIQKQVQHSTATYLASRKSTRKWQSDKALTWLVRYLFLNESFNAISDDSEKFLANPKARRGKPYGVAAVIRDVEEIAGQLGLELKKRGRGRPLGRRDSKTLRKIVGMPRR